MHDCNLKFGLFLDSKSLVLGLDLLRVSTNSAKSVLSSSVSLSYFYFYVYYTEKVLNISEMLELGVWQRTLFYVSEEILMVYCGFM